MRKLNSDQVLQRRLILRVAVKIMLWVSLLIGVWVIFSPLFVNGRPINAKVVETGFDVSEMRPGDVRLVEWFSKPLIIAHRSDGTEAKLLSGTAGSLRDPLSLDSIQPAFATNALRSATPQWFVSLGLGTGSGCAVVYTAPSSEIVNGVTWVGGFTDHCDSSRYDLAGRVLENQASRSNTTIPVWRYESGKIIVSTEKYR